MVVGRAPSASYLAAAVGSVTAGPLSQCALCELSPICNFPQLKVAVLGAAGGIGQPLSMLLKVRRDR